MNWHKFVLLAQVAPELSSLPKVSDAIPYLMSPFTQVVLVGALLFVTAVLAVFIGLSVSFQRTALKEARAGAGDRNALKESVEDSEKAIKELVAEVRRDAETNSKAIHGHLDRLEAAVSEARGYFAVKVAELPEEIAGIFTPITVRVDASYTQLLSILTDFRKAAREREEKEKPTTNANGGA